ncbi:MAG: hypothetical protein ILP19_07510 [Oscillospiraceae bacterium]|nr:hypothetical protein [Oscillospiraceae bacterium]
MKKLSYYIIPVMVHMAIVCVIAALMGISGIRTGYDSAAGMVLIAAGGISSALWGALWQIRYNSRRVKDIVLDFFHIKADIKAYLLVLLFLVLDFVPVWFGGAALAKWYVMLLVFLRSLVFGGIEEIGWRYTFQPELEKGMPYIAATLLTFICWGIWHFMFF